MTALIGIFLTLSATACFISCFNRTEERIWARIAFATLLVAVALLAIGNRLA